MNDWGAGYFLAVKFGSFSEGLTYEDVQVGLDPSAGSGLITLDSDCNGVFKISDKDTQVLKVVQSDGTHTLTQTFDLSGLTLESKPVNTVSPTSAIFDKNESGVNYGNKVFTVTPATPGATIDKFQFYDEDTQSWTDVPSDVGGTDIYSIDGLVLTAYPIAFMSHEAGAQLQAKLVLTDGSSVNISLTIEDTT